MTILVWADSPTVAATLTSRARRIADPLGWEVALMLLVDQTVDESPEPGVDVVYRVATATRSDDSDACVDALSRVVALVKPTVTLIGASKLGLEVAPRLAERTGADYAPWLIQLNVDGSSGAITARCTSHAGLAETTSVFKRGHIIATAAQVSPENSASAGREPRVVTIDLPFRLPRVSVLAKRPKVKGERLETARAIVDVGQGVRQRDDLGQIAVLAGLLDARVACTRPVASERDWFPEWLGLSGTKVSPEFCLTVGVSGAVQHIVGIRGSRIIAAINSDENAAMLSEVDFGVVADLYEFVPILIDRLVARGVRPVWSAP